MSKSVQPYGQQPNRLLCPQDSPGKNTGVSCFIDYNKALDCVDHNKLWKILKEMGIPNHLTCLLRNLYEPDMEQQTGSKLGKEYITAVYCHPVYSTYM